MARKPKAKAETAIVADIVRSWLDYDPQTGVFVWRVGRGPAQPGKVAGISSRTDGYGQICLMGRNYYAHRLAWLYVYGAWPSEQIDHIDGNPSNNAISNLRACSNAENCQNLGVRKSNTSGIPGVRWDKQRRKWAAHIRVDGHVTQLGRFSSIEEATEAHARAKAAHHSFQPQQRIA